jgi:hypothetical protein
MHEYLLVVQNIENTTKILKDLYPNDEKCYTRLYSNGLRDGIITTSEFVSAASYYAKLKN